MRLYVVLASVNPMRGYLCRVGMVRKAMVAYQEPDETNVKQLHMHLTNTSLNCKVNDAVECTFNAARVTRLSLTLASLPHVYTSSPLGTPQMTRRRRRRRRRRRKMTMTMTMTTQRRNRIRTTSPRIASVFSAM
jgi:hypothetical protein